MKNALRIQKTINKNESMNITGKEIGHQVNTDAIKSGMRESFIASVAFFIRAWSRKHI